MKTSNLAKRFMFLCLLLNTAYVFSQGSLSSVPLSFSYATENDKIVEGYWQNDNFITFPFAISYEPITKKSSLSQLSFDTISFEFQDLQLYNAYFTKIKAINGTMYYFMSLENKKDSFSTIEYYIDPKDGNLVFRQLNCNQNAFKTSSEFYSYIQKQLTDTTFLRPYIRFYNSKTLKGLKVPKGYTNKTGKLKFDFILNGDLKSSDGRTLTTASLNPYYGNKFSLITINMPNRNCPPCQTAIEKICKNIDLWKSLYKLDYKVIVAFKKNYSYPESNCLDFKKSMGNKYDLYFDEDYKFVNNLGVKAMPITILINSKGEILEQFQDNYSSTELENLLKKYK